MWIVPKTLSHFVPATEGLNLDLEEQAWMLEQSATANETYVQAVLVKGIEEGRLDEAPIWSDLYLPSIRVSWKNTHLWLPLPTIQFSREERKKTQDTLKSENTPGQLEFNGFLQKTSKDIFWTLHSH